METDLSIARGVAGVSSLSGRQEIPAVETNPPFPFHTLNFWGDVNHSNSPYGFGLNVERYRELVSGVFELTPEDTRRIDIHIVGEGRLGLPREVRQRILLFGGKKRVIGRQITVGLTGLYFDAMNPSTPVHKMPIDASIYLFCFWHFFKTERRLIMSYVKSKQKEKHHKQLLGKHMRVFTITDEMLEFLESSPEAVDERLRKLAGIKLREDILAYTIHEAASHFFDTARDTVDGDEEEKKKLVARLLGGSYEPPNFMDQFRQHPVVKKLLPNPPKPSKPDRFFLEDLAKAAEKLAMDPRWKDLIDFEINPNWPFQKKAA